MDREFDWGGGGAYSTVSGLMYISLKWPTKRQRGVCLSSDNTDQHLLGSIGADRTNDGGKILYTFPIHPMMLCRVPRCCRQFNLCCSPRPMSKVIGTSGQGGVGFLRRGRVWPSPWIGWQRLRGAGQSR